MTGGLDHLVAYHCAPTLMGMKAGNMLCLKRSAFTDREQKVRDALHMLREKGLSAKVFHTLWDASLIYLYRMDLLNESLSHPLSRSLLSSLHYRGQDTEELLEQLGRRMEGNESFPHEIGLFLGYPPEDVAGFVQHKGAGCKFCGCWKVYGDVEKAKAIFDQYAYCRFACLQGLKSGMTLHQIACAI